MSESDTACSLSAGPSAHKKRPLGGGQVLQNQIHPGLEFSLDMQDKAGPLRKWQLAAACPALG